MSKALILKTDSIGVFDSGIGGLTVASRLHELMPNERLIYFGDTAKVPYGGRSVQEITDLSCDIIRFLSQKKVKAIVVACNTVSVTCLKELREISPVPVIGIIDAGVASVCGAGNIKRAGIIGTVRTIASGAHKTKLAMQKPNLEVFDKACPLFVPLAEEGFFSGDIAKLTAQHYLGELLYKNIEALLLACTHYALLFDAIKSCTGSVKVIDPAYKIAEVLKNILSEKDMLSDDPVKKEPIFYLSGATSNFGLVSLKTFGKEYEAEIVNISNRA